MRRRTRRGAPDGGSVTAELAVALVAVTVVLAAALGTASLGVAQLRCADAARAAARAAARGEPLPAVERLASRLAGPGAVVTASRDAGLVRVRVSARVRLPLPGAAGVAVGADAAVPAEPGPAAVP